MRGGQISARQKVEKRFFIFKSLIQTVLNRPTETKRAVRSYRSSLSSTWKEVTDWL